MSDAQGYMESRATRVMRALPRFGHSSNFAYIAGRKDQQQDYIYGLLFAGIAMIAFFLAWIIIVSIFKCLGQKKVGFLSGKAFEVPHGSKRPRRVRISFVVAAIMVVIFAFLLVFKGLTELKESMHTVHLSSLRINGIVSDAENLTSVLMQLANKTTPLVAEWNGTRLDQDFCPNIDIAAVSGVDFDALSESVSQAVDNFAGLYKEELNNVDKALLELEDITASMAETTDAITLTSWQSLIFLIPYPIFCVVFIVGVVLAAHNRTFRRYRCLLTWGALPWFTLFVVITAFLSGSIAIAASANADFCSGGTDNTPESSLVDMMHLNGYSKNDTVLLMVDFYVKQCVANFGGNVDPLLFLDEFQQDLEVAVNATLELQASIENVTADELNALCSGRDFSEIDTLLALMTTAFLDLSAVAIEAIELLACERILPIYTTAFWDGTCQYSVEGFTWTFSAFFVIGVMGMLMITFRASWLLTEYADSDKPHTTKGVYQEVEYDPSTALPLEDSDVEESLSELKGSPQDNEPPQVNEDGDGIEVATGVAIGSAAAAAESLANSDGDSNDGSETKVAASEKGDDSDDGNTRETEKSPSVDDASTL